MTAHDPDPIEPDHVTSRGPVLALAVTLVAIAMSLAAVWLMLGTTAGGGEAQKVPDTIVPPDVPFALPTEGEIHRAEVKARLAGWAWAPSPSGAHTHVIVPIGVAMARELSRGKR